mmetsp:Transcript_17183/g.46631  ORF Transcript_17183/g.46631 Transcript_17183/m.46631 type:complete len:168 (-) Transcript_17183:166-669(-)
MAVAILQLLSAAAALTSPLTPRRTFLCRSAAALVGAQPLAALAASDCLKTCLQNCGRLASGSGSYCKDSCAEYCDQDDRKDGLSGSVSTDGAEFGFASSFKLPNAPQKPTVYGEDLPPGLPDVFGLNKQLRKVVTGGAGGDVQGAGGARDFKGVEGNLFDPNKFRAK